MSQKNVEIVRRAYESFNEMERVLHPDVEYHTYSDSPEAGVYRGVDEVIRYNQRLLGRSRTFA